MKIPLEIVPLFFLAQPTMLTVMILEPGEVAFQTIGGNRNQRIVKVMEHIRQSFQEHTAGSFDVTENVSGLTSPTYLGAVFTLPVGNSVEKSVPVCQCSNSGYLEKDFSKLSGIGSSWGDTAPRQALPLHMNQTSLHCNLWPEFTDDSDHIRITPSTVKLNGRSPSVFKRFKNIRS